MVAPEDLSDCFLEDHEPDRILKLEAGIDGLTASIEGETIVNIYRLVRAFRSHQPDAVESLRTHRLLVLEQAADNKPINFDKVVDNVGQLAGISFDLRHDIREQFDLVRSIKLSDADQLKALGQLDPFNFEIG